MNFSIGQKVVCVNTTPDLTTTCPLDLLLLKKGEIYTVAGKTIAPWSGQNMILLAEIPIMQGEGYYAWRFRPLQKQTNIEVFRRLLKAPETKKVIKEKETEKA